MSTYFHQLPDELNILIFGYIYEKSRDFIVPYDIVFSQCQLLLKMKDPDFYDFLKGYWKIRNISIHDWFIIFANYWIFKENKIATDDSKYTFRYKKDDLTGPFWTFRFKKDDLKLYYKEIQTYERILQNLIVYMVLPDGRNLYD